MTTPQTRAAAMAAGRRADSQRRRERVAQAIAHAAAAGTPTSISAIARAAGVDRSFLYRPQHRDLLAALHTAASPPTGAGDMPAASRASLQADLANSQDRCKRLAAHIALLEKRLSTLMGEHAWNQSGLGAAVDLDELRTQIHQLEEANAELRAKVEDLDDELEAARATNRELIAQNNTGHRPEKQPLTAPRPSVSSFTTATP
jgi:cell division protein FtsB